MSVEVYLTGAVLAILLPLFLYRRYRLSDTPSKQVGSFLERTKHGPIAHRASTPENTLAGLRRAKEEGASAVEVDLEFTRDGVPVLLHDSTVDRTSNGSGRVGDLTFEELRRLDFGSKFGEEFTGEKIPTLQEATEECKRLGLIMLLEIKRNSDKAIKVLKKLFFEQPDLYNHVAVISFCPNTIYKLRATDSNVVCGLLLVHHIVVRYPDGRGKGKPAWRLFLSPIFDALYFWSIRSWLARLLGIKLLVVQKDILLGKSIDVQKWGNHGYYIAGWTVNKKEEKQYFEEVLNLPYQTDAVPPGSSCDEHLDSVETIAFGTLLSKVWATCWQPVQVMVQFTKRMTMCEPLPNS